MNHIQKENLIHVHQNPVYVPCYPIHEVHDARNPGNLRLLSNHFHKSCEGGTSLVF